ncbi:HD family phosphohydrolase [Candidatus Omnitrophota bacterium]
MKSFFSRFKNQQRLGVKTDLKKPLNLTMDMLPRILLGVVVAGIVAAIYLSLSSKSAGWIAYTIPELREDDISRTRVVAPFEFTVPKNERDLEQERLSAEVSALPVFSLDTTVQGTINAEIDSLFKMVSARRTSDDADSLTSLPMMRLFGRLNYGYVDTLASQLKGTSQRSTRNLISSIKRSVNMVFAGLVVSSLDDIYAQTDELFILEDGDESRRIGVNETIGVIEAGDLVIQALIDEYSGTLAPEVQNTLQTVIKRLIRPNVWYNRERSMDIRRAESDAVSTSLAEYKMNEQIIDANEPVSAIHVAVLETLRREMSAHSFSENPREHYLIAIGKIIVVYGIIGLFLMYLYLCRKNLFNSFSLLLLLTVIAFLPLSISFYAAWSGTLSEYFIPVAVASILVTILFDAELGLMISMVISLLVVSMIPGLGLRMGIIYYLAGGVGAVTVGRVRHRKEFYRVMFLLPVTIAVTVAATNDWLAHPSFRDVVNDMLYGAINGFICPIFVIGFLPLLESFFKVATNMTLLELSDLNNPLLKELAVKAPGTFSSVLVVGSLSEVAAERIGANALLSRVGSYYHDIGKTVIPEYFIENQMGGKNPHDRLSPHMSALVIASHVKEGYELGVKYGLPEAILDIIQQHHGTSLMASIYHKALNDSEDNKADESAFRYPGPKPQSREAAIVMLADLVEAASRSVQERSPGRLITLINTIIQKRFMEGELDQCDLTLKDLHDIEESFLPVLVGSHHGRIEYPWQKTDKSVSRKEKLNNGTEKTVNNKDGKKNDGYSKKPDNDK